MQKASLPPPPPPPQTQTHTHTHAHMRAQTPPTHTHPTPTYHLTRPHTHIAPHPTPPSPGDSAQLLLAVLTTRLCKLDDAPVKHLMPLDAYPPLSFLRRQLGVLLGHQNDVTTVVRRSSITGAHSAAQKAYADVLECIQLIDFRCSREGRECQINDALRARMLLQHCGRWLWGHPIQYLDPPLAASAPLEPNGGDTATATESVPSQPVVEPEPPPETEATSPSKDIEPLLVPLQSAVADASKAARRVLEMSLDESSEDEELQSGEADGCNTKDVRDFTSAFSALPDEDKAAVDFFCCTFDDSWDLFRQHNPEFDMLVDDLQTIHDDLSSKLEALSSESMLFLRQRATLAPLNITKHYVRNLRYVRATPLAATTRPLLPHHVPSSCAALALRC